MGTLGRTALRPSRQRLGVVEHLDAPVRADTGWREELKSEIHDVWEGGRPHRPGPAGWGTISCTRKTPYKGTAGVALPGDLEMNVLPALCAGYRDAYAAIMNFVGFGLLEHEGPTYGDLRRQDNAALGSVTLRASSGPTRSG